MGMPAYIISIPFSSGETSYVSSLAGKMTSFPFSAISFETCFEAHAFMKGLIASAIADGQPIASCMKNYKLKMGNPDKYKKIICHDGFSMSVQASSIHYCYPKKDYAQIYSEVEVGFPSEEEPLLTPYQDGEGSPTASVYAYVPSKLVFQIIDNHGGIKIGQVPNLA